MTTRETAEFTESQIAALEMLQPLTEAERLDARDAARKLAIRKFGPEPKRSDFQQATQGRYPRWLTWSVAIMLLIVFFAAANVSVFRVFTAGRDHFMESINIGWQAAIVGASTFILAEFAVIASTIAMRIYFDGRDRWLMGMPILLGLAMAFVGNYTITQPNTVWAWLETITPPAAVLFMAVIGERLILSALETRQANELAFQRAHQDWRERTADPEASPQWRITYGNALREAIRKKNASGRGRAEREQLMQAMRGPEWSAVVWREFEADNWLQNLPPMKLEEIPAGAIPAPKDAFRLAPVVSLKPAVSGNGNTRHR